MAAPADAVRALAFVRQQATAGRVTYTEKAILELLSLDSSLDAADISTCLCAAAADEIFSYEPDHSRPDRMALKLRTRVSGRLCYCKVALRPGWDRTVAVLSFKEWKKG